MENLEGMENGEIEEEKDEEIEDEKKKEKDSNKDEQETENPEILKLKDELSSKEAEIKRLSDSYMRLQADFANYKKRTEKEKASNIAYANEDLICDLLPVIDNFERALEVDDDKKDSFWEGVKLIYDQLTKVLIDNGVEEIEALGKKFDPNYHHAALMEESDEDEGTVLEVFQKGYMLKEKIIRPSMVKVARKKE